ncbi:MAG: MraY family glycosyltransferase, partial [Pseudomonadales bacterium]
LITYAGDVIGIGGIGTAFLATPITVLAIVTAVNAFNMIDGIDGLAASLAITTFASLALIFGIYGMHSELVICLAFIGSIIPFLLANFPLWPFRQKIFLGDAGSILIGFCIVWLMIDGSQPPDRANPESRAFYPVTAMWLVGVPLFDLMSVSIRRMLRGESPLKGDRDHIHHLLQRMELSPRVCLLSCVALELALSLIGITFEVVRQEALSFGFFWLAFIGYHVASTFLSKRQNH